MADRCSLYAIEKETLPDPIENLSPDNQLVWDHLENMMNLVKELIVDFSMEQGINLDSVSADDVDADFEKAEEEMDGHPLSQLTLQYADDCKSWFENNRRSIEALAEVLNQKATLEIGIEENQKQAVEINDYVEIIHWYQYQIHIKIKRALLPDMLFEEFSDPVQNDHNGSAKVALIGTERSIAAWYGLLKFLPEHEDDILAFLVLLERTRKGIEKCFKNVHRFLRPGFDDEVKN